MFKILKRRTLFGNNVSHSNKKTKRKFLLNCHNHKFFLKNKNKFIKIKISKYNLRIIYKIGLYNYLKLEYGKKYKN